MRTITPTSSRSYHSSIGFVHIIPRPRLRLSDCMGTPRLWHGSGFCDDIWIDKLMADGVYIVELGCGTLLQFDQGDLFDDDGRRFIADFEDAIVIDKLPDELDFSHLPAFEF